MASLTERFEVRLPRKVAQDGWTVFCEQRSEPLPYGGGWGKVVQFLVYRDGELLYTRPSLWGARKAIKDH